MENLRKAHIVGLVLFIIALALFFLKTLNFEIPVIGGITIFSLSLLAFSIVLILGSETIKFAKSKYIIMGTGWPEGEAKILRKKNLNSKIFIKS